MTQDWLRDLRESKFKLIAEQEAAALKAIGARTTNAERLEHEQSQIGNSLQGLAIETVLSEFANEILKGHPLFRNCSLVRTVSSRPPDSELKVIEPAPWTGSVDNNLLSLPLDLANGNFIVAIDWLLEASCLNSATDQTNPFALRASLSARGAALNQTPISSADDLKSEVIAAFQQAVDLATRSRARRKRHHHRPWYKRLWRSIFPASGFKPIYSLIAFAIVLLVLLMALILVPNLYTLFAARGV